MVKGASGNLQKEKIINKRKHAGRRPIGIKYFEARMVYRLRCIYDFNPDINNVAFTIS